ncbi:hypothetical protein ACFPRL_32545 [Pseudoclavibacter helvolus]
MLTATVDLISFRVRHVYGARQFMTRSPPASLSMVCAMHTQVEGNPCRSAHNRTSSPERA